jgi:hypothetical protein
MTVRVTSLTADDRPAVATFRFDEPLESSSFVWLCFRGIGFEPFVPPAVGREIEIRFDLRAVLTPPGMEWKETGRKDAEEFRKTTNSLLEEQVSPQVEPPG